MVIAFLRGKLASVGADWAVIEVGGVGYRVLAPSSTLLKLPDLGKEVFLHTHLAVRDDEMFLFGFSGDNELATFLQLLNVGGVGPRSALAVLSVLTPGELAGAVAVEDVEQLVRVPGVGKKTARRIILELKDKLAVIVEPGPNTGLGSIPGVGLDRDAVEALMTLGYGISEARGAVQAALVQGKVDSTAELLKVALRLLAINK